MGRTTADALVDARNEFSFPLETMLYYHLSSNHYPPINDVFIPVAIEAITRAQDQNYDSILDLEEITGKSGFRKPKMYVWEVIEDFT